MKSRLLVIMLSALSICSLLLTACGSAPATTPSPVAAGATPTVPAAASTATSAPAPAAPATATSSPAGAATDTPAAAATTPAGPATATLAASAAGATSTAAAPPPAPTSPPRPGEKVLRVNLQVEPLTTDPQKMSVTRDIGWGALAFEGLLELNEQLQPVPAAAEHMDRSADGLRYTLTLRDGLTYSDGVPLTAHNFEYAFRRLFDPALPGRDYASVAYDIQGAQALSEFTDLTDTVKLKQLQDALGVHALDDGHIVFTLAHPAAYFPYILAIWVGWPTREDMVRTGGASWTEPATYIGNGPYILREWSHGSGAVWEANPHYRKGRPQIDRLEFREITDTEVAFQAYKTGELDVVAVPPADVQAVRADPRLKAQYARLPGSCSYYIGFNVTKAPFDNVKVRQAFARAIDRQDYVDTVFKGAGAVAPSFIPPGRPGYEPGVQQAGFDPAAARQMLAAVIKADYPGGLPPITLTFPADDLDKRVAEWIQNQLQTNLGLKVAVDLVEMRAYAALVTKAATTPQLFGNGWCEDYPDPQDWLSLVFRSGSAQNEAQWKNADFDRLTRQADVEPDPARRRALYKQASQLLADEAPVVFLNWSVTDWLIQPGLKNVREHLNSDDTIIPGFKNIVNFDIQ